MKIVFTGAPSSGKTTVFDILKNEKYCGFEYINEQVREISHFWDMDDEDKQYTAFRFQENIEKGKENFISDRSAIDVYIYSIITKIENEVLLTDVYNHSKKYDLIIFFSPVSNFVPDGFRTDTQKEFNDEFENQFRGDNRIYYVKGKSINGRVKEIKTLITLTMKMNDVQRAKSLMDYMIKGKIKKGDVW